MVKCPNCQQENVESRNFCENCMEDLRYDSEAGKEVHLVTVFSEEEALVLEGLLKSEGIHFYRRNDRVGDFLKATTGTTDIGLSIFVSEKDYTLAHELINSEPVPFDETEFQNDDDFAGDMYDKVEVNSNIEVGEGSTSLLIIILLMAFLVYLLIR